MPELLPLVIEYRDEAQKIALLAIVAATWRWGAGPERLSALALLYIVAVHQAYHAVFGPGVTLAEIDLGHAAIDGTACIAMLAIAASANRMYTLWLGALQIIAVQAHIARDLESGISPGFDRGVTGQGRNQGTCPSTFGR